MYPVSTIRRHVEKFGLGVGRIYLVGGEWRKWESERVMFIHFPDLFANWYLNTALKVWVATLREDQ